MHQRKFLMLVSVVCISCNKSPTSDFKIGRLDTIAVQSMINKSILTSSNSVTGITEYQNATDGVTTKVIVNDLGKITAIIQRRNGVRIFGSEYYPNGQEMGDIPLTTDGKMTGEATYYYEDGKLRSRGRLQDGVQVGEWKDYDRQGNLVKKYKP
jgi:antitoxin component YwqK of YwqJK toxin-antitoxin module